MPAYIWCSVCQFMCQYKNSTKAGSRMERVLFRKSDVASIRPQCWGRDTKYASQLPMKLGMERITGRTQSPDQRETQRMPKWKPSNIRDHCIDLRCCAGWSLRIAVSHSLNETSVRPVRPVASRIVSQIADNSPPFPNVLPGWVNRFSVNSCSRNVRPTF